MRTVFLFALPFLTILYGCHGASSNGRINLRDTFPGKKALTEDASIPGNFSAQQSLHFDSSEIGKFLRAYDSLSVYRDDILEFYRRRRYAFAWFDEGGLIEQSGDLFNKVAHLESEGIPAGTPYLATYRKLMEEVGTTAKGQPKIQLEIMQTAQYFYYANKVWEGIPESQSQKMAWMVPRKKLDYDHLLDSTLRVSRAGDTIREPVHRQYRLLRDYLHRFRDIEKKGSWMTIRASNKKLRVGDSSETIAQIRRKLFLARDLHEDNGSRIFDTSLEEAVKRFQQRYGLLEDGVVGPAVMREMNAPLSKRMQQIIVNMERCRWVSDNPPGDYLVVNIPQFKLLVFENDRLAWDCNVVVGEEMHKTAVFQGMLKTIVFSPYWNVPPGILKNEILPAIRRTPDYLERHDMEWQNGQLRQRPGPANPLGLVKFHFPNSYNIYLHDSPAKSLFNQPKRTFSHGCIRLAEARRLAIYLLRNDPAWTTAKIDAAMNSGRESFVPLEKPMPVSIVYFTAWVDAGGRIHFRDDVYKRDARLMEAIFAKK